MPQSIESVTTDSRTVGDRDRDFSSMPATPSSPCPISGKGVQPTLSQPPPQMFSKRLFQKGDPEVARARAIYLSAYLSGLAMVIVTIFVVFSIYWGSLWKVPVRALPGWIVDFDGGDVGQTVIHGLTSTKTRMIQWEVVPTDKFPQGLQDVIHDLLDDQAWVVIAINKGATIDLQNAVAFPDPSYNGSAAITAYAVEARNENAFRNFIRPMVQASLDIIKVEYAIQFASELPSMSVDLATLLATSPQTLVNPISYTIINILPFNQPVASAVVFVGLIYLLILSFFVVMVAHGAREASGINRILQYKSLVGVRLASSFFGYFLLSFFYSLLNLAFKLDVTRKYGRGGFLIFWMLNWIGMLSVGLALESLITILTARFIPFFMILWIIVNVSVCVFPIEILPQIFHYGYAAPFYNISHSIRSIVFGTKNTLGQNFGVLFGWVLVSCITLPLLQWVVRNRDIEQHEATKPNQPQLLEPPSRTGTTFDEKRYEVPDSMRSMPGYNIDEVRRPFRECDETDCESATAVDISMSRTSCV